MKLTEYEDDYEDHGCQEERLKVDFAEGDVKDGKSRVAREHHDTEASEGHGEGKAGGGPAVCPGL